MVYLVFLSVGEIRPTENRVPKQTLAVAFTKFCFEAMLLHKNVLGESVLQNLIFKTKHSVLFMETPGRISCLMLVPRVVIIILRNWFLLLLQVFPLSADRKLRVQVLAPVS